MGACIIVRAQVADTSIREAFDRVWGKKVVRGREIVRVVQRIAREHLPGHLEREDDDQERERVADQRADLVDGEQEALHGRPGDGDRRCGSAAPVSAISIGASAGNGLYS